MQHVTRVAALSIFWGIALCFAPHRVVAAAPPTTLPGGREVWLDDIDDVALDVGSGARATRQGVSVREPGVPLDRAARVQVIKPGVNPWDVSLNCPVWFPVAKGDALLLSVWLRVAAPPAGADEAVVTIVLEQREKPYRKLAMHRVVLDNRWARFDVPAAVGADFKASALHVSLQLGHEVQTIDVGGLRLFNYGAAVPAARLPAPAVRYVGQSANAAWRRDAADRIAKLRTAELTALVTDAAGRPVPNAEVRFEMKRHAFPFGTAVNTTPLTGHGPDAERYREQVQRLFNRSVLEWEMKWPAWEQDRRRSLEAVRWLREHDLDVRGHNLLWPGAKLLPADVLALKDDKQALRKRVLDHIAEEVAAFRGQCVEWDVVNEPYANHLVQDALGQEFLVDCFKAAHEQDPAARLFLNDYPIPMPRDRSDEHNDHFERTLRMLKEHGAPLGGIGFQFHFISTPTPPHLLRRGLDRFAELKLPIEATELDFETRDEALQADYLRDVTMLLFSHPAVEGIVQWGFWAGSHWRPDAALFRKDWSIKPAGQAWMDLVFKEWWTDARATTDAAGRCAVRGFLGEYEITATVAGKKAVVKASLAKPGGTVTVVVP